MHIYVSYNLLQWEYLRYRTVFDNHFVVQVSTTIAIYAVFSPLDTYIPAICRRIYVCIFIIQSLFPCLGERDACIHIHKYI